MLLLAGTGLSTVSPAGGRALAAGRAPVVARQSGGVLADPAAVAVTSAGDYFVADAGHNRVVHYDAQGTYLGAIGQPTSHHPNPAKGDLSSPTGVALDGKGNLFVADLGNARVAEFNLSGAYIGQIGSYGFDAGKLLGPSAVAVGTDGRVYVLDTGAAKVDVFSATGAFVTRWGSYGSGFGEFDGPSGLALDAHDNVYVADTNNNRVQEFSSSGTYTAQWGQFGHDEGNFRYPTAVAVDRDGTIWVDDAGNGRVVQIQHPQTYQGSFPLSGTPNGVAISDLTLYVVDTQGEHITAYAASGPQQSTFAKGGHGNGQLSRPVGVAVDKDGNIYVADTNNNRIEKFNASGNMVATYGAQGKAHAGPSPRFTGPQAVALDDAGNIYVADSFNSQIQKLDPNGNFVWAQHVGGQPRGIAVDAQGNVFATSFFNDTVLKFDQSGKLITQWGGRGHTNGLFVGPAGIAVDRAGRVYVADTGNGRVAVFSLLPNGTYGYSGQFGGAGTGEGQFSNLAGITIAADGVVYAVDAGGLRVEKFDPFGAHFTSWSGNGQLQSLSGLALDDRGNVVVTDTLSALLTVFSATGKVIRQIS